MRFRTGYTRHTFMYLCMAAAAGCGALGGPATSDHVPNAGVTGWHLLPSNSQTEIQEPFVFCPPGGARAPAVVRGGSGVVWRLWYVTADGAVGGATSSDGLYDWVDDGPLALAGGPWSDVSVARDGEIWRLAAATSDGSRISIFGSVDGAAWAPVASLAATEPWEAGRVGGPALLADPISGGWILFHEGARRGAIGAATSADGETWVDSSEPILTPATIAASTEWSVLSLGAPSAAIDTSRPGPAVYKLWFEAKELRHGRTPSLSESADVVGFAGSFDGVTWQAFAGNPVFQQRLVTIPNAPPVFTPTREPSVVATGASWRMYFEDPFDNGTAPVRACVAVAVTP